MKSYLKTSEETKIPYSELIKFSCYDKNETRVLSKVSTPAEIVITFSKMLF